MKNLKQSGSYSLDLGLAVIAVTAAVIGGLNAINGSLDNVFAALAKEIETIQPDMSDGSLTNPGNGNGNSK